MVVVAAAGMLAGADMARRAARPVTGGLLPIAVFGLLGLGWSLMTFKVDRRRGGRAAVTLAPAAYEALFPLGDPAGAGIVALLTTVFDWAAHRRGLLQGAFNVGQVLAAAWAGTRAAEAVTAATPGLPGIGAGALAGAAVFTAINFALTYAAMSLATGRSARDSGVISYAALSNEIVVGCFAALLALSWSAHPALLVVSVVPPTLLFLILSRLEEREGALRRRQKELQSLQELGLRVSAQLDTTTLASVATQIVAHDLRARGAVLAFVGDSEYELRVAAVSDRREEINVPPRLPRGGFDGPFLARREPMIGDPVAVRRFPELSLFGVTSFIAHPLWILGEPAGVLAVYDDGGREPFGAEDARRLSALVRFIEVALDNAKLYDDLREMQQQLIQTEKMTAMGQLVSGVAHELNNPLATISGTAELVEQRSLPEDVARMVRRIRREADRASRIVRSLLTFSRAHKPEVGWHSLNPIVEEVLELRSYECRVRNITLTHELDPDLPLVRVDPHQIHQVLLNLVTNAVHAIEETDRPGLILVRTYREGDTVRLEVSDNGPGIPEENLGKLFNPFFTTKEVGKGTGLGLSICYGIVREHRGRISVRSVPGRGATFTVELPIPDEPAPAEPTPVPAAASAQAPPPDGKGRRVLVADDEAGIREVLREALEAWGFTVDTVPDGHRGLERLRERRYDLAILDLRMPGLDGQGLYDRARAEGLTFPPVIFSTGDAVSAEARSFLDRVAAPVLLKPFSLAGLREAIEAATTGVSPRDTAPAAG
ncbi:MAG: response regulator [Acidobacteria bacterium]|nr:MAG: response regulator [Acidobacteriota bacterium]